MKSVQDHINGATTVCEYDTETGFYYLNSRYYDPVEGRFLNADGVMSGASGSLQGNNLYAYCFNNPVNLTDDNGNWPEWLDYALAKYREYSFVYNVLIKNISADFGIGFGIGGSVKVGIVSVPAISRADAFGIEAHGDEVNYGHYGKTALSVGVGNYFIGMESNSYESFDGTVHERTSGENTGAGVGVDVGFGFSIHFGISFSFSGFINSLIEYSRKWN